MATQTEYTRSSFAYLPPAAQLALLTLPRRSQFLMAHAAPPPKRILDVGCATGYIALLLMQLGHKVTGIELNERMVYEARGKGVEVLQYDLEQPLPLQDGCMDVVHACEVIEHLFDTESFLKELHRVLTTEGVLILSTPNLNSLENRFRVLLGRPLPMWGAYPADRHGSHVRVFNQAKIVELLQRTGFRPETIIGINQSRLARVLDHLPTWSEMLLIKAVRI